MSTTDSVSKLPKLCKPDDYILWKHRVFAYLRQSELLGFQVEPTRHAPSIREKWFEMMIKANSTAILCLGDSPLAKVRRLVTDDDVTAKALWDELEKIHTASNAQAVLNLRQEIDEFRLEDNNSWEEHVKKFTELSGKLATYDEELSDKEKASKLLRTLPEAFSGFAMIAQVQELELQRLIQAMHAEISHRKSIKSSLPSIEKSPKSASVEKTSKRKVKPFRLPYLEV